MFNIEQYDDIILHLKSISSRFYKHTSGWIEIFCPYCDDANRKLNPKHGHFHIAPNYPFGHCFRCGTPVGLDKLLLDTNFSNLDLIKQLRRTNGFIHSKSGRFKSSSIETKQNIFKNALEHYQVFYEKHNEQFNIFKQYIYNRCGDIDILYFNLSPTIYQNNVAVQFYNYDGQLTTTRMINSYSNSFRYLIPKEKQFYYFQDLLDIDEYNDIIITEGAFDLINLRNYYLPFNGNNSFYLALSGNNYKGLITELVQNYLLIGEYNIHIVFDNGLKFFEKLLKSIKTSINEINTEIHLKFYLPDHGKDVSEIMSLKQL